MKKSDFWLLLLLLLAAFIRLYHTPGMVLSNDEIISLACANGSQVMYDTVPVPGYKSEEFTQTHFTQKDNFAGTVKATISDNGNSVLYYLFLNIYSGYTGNDHFLARIPSTLFQLIALFILFTIVLNSCGLMTAVITGLVFAVEPFMIPLSYYIRGYSLAVLLSLISVFLFLRIVKKRTGFWVAILFGVTTGLALLAHYMTFVIPVGMLAFKLFRVRDGHTYVKFFSGGTVAAIILGGWMVTGGLDGFKSASKINERLIQRSEDAAKKEMVTWPIKTYSSQAVIPVYRYFAMLVGNDLTRVGIKIRYIMIMVFLSVIAIIFLLYRYRKVLPDYIWLSIYVLSASIIISTFTALKSGHMTSFEYTHYMMSFSILIIGYLIGSRSNVHTVSARFAHVVVLAGALIMPVGIVAEMNDRLPPPGRLSNPFETAAQRIEQSVQDGDLVVYSTWYDATVTNLYLHSENLKQMVDASAASRILIKQASGEEKEIINLKGQYN